MKKQIQFAPSYAARYSGAEFTTYHSRVYTLIGNWDGPYAKANIPEEVMQKWLASIEMLTNINREATASVETARLAEIDKERDNYLTYLFDSVKNARRSPNSAKREAAERLHIVTKTYAGIQREMNEKETALINGLLHDLEKPQESAAVTELGLNDVCDELEMLNGEYSQLAINRAQSTAAGKLPPAKEVRTEADSYLQYAKDCIFATHLLTTDTELEKKLELLAGDINQVATDFKARNKQSQASKKKE